MGFSKIHTLEVASTRFVRCICMHFVFDRLTIVVRHFVPDYACTSFRKGERRAEVTCSSFFVQRITHQVCTCHCFVLCPRQCWFAAWRWLCFVLVLYSMLGIPTYGQLIFGVFGAVMTALG